jgi:hypothetical protein
MAVTDGQDADQTTFNNAFVSKTVDSTTVGKITLANVDAASGATVTNQQRETNSLNSFTGRASGTAHDVKPTWTNNDVGTSTDDLKTRIDLLTALFNNLSGHTHDVSVTGNGGPVIEASDTVSGIVNITAQNFGGVKTFSDGMVVQNGATIDQILGNLCLEQEVDSTSTGASAALSIPAKFNYKVTNASLTSIATVSAKSGLLFILTNATGAAITILNNSGASVDSILTGTGATITLEDSASVILFYDDDSTRYRVIGGSGGGGSGGGTANDTFTGTTIAVGSGTSLFKYRYTGGSAQTLASVSSAADGDIIFIVGTSDTNTITLNHNDVAGGWILNGNIVLGAYDSLQMIYDSSLDRWVEVSRSVK